MGIFDLVFARMLFGFVYLICFSRDSIAIACYISYFALDVSVHLKLHGKNHVNNC